MGERIHKQLGYGLTVPARDSRVDWERLNRLLEESSDGELMEQLMLTPSHFAGFMDAARKRPGYEHHGVDRLVGVEDVGGASETVFLFEEEDGMDEGTATVLITTPVLAGNDSRESDTHIAWAEYESLFPDRATRMQGMVMPMRLHPYPYTEMLADKASRKPVDNDYARRFIRDGVRSESVPDMLLVRRTPYASVEELVEKSVLLPPMDVGLYASWLDIFTSQDVVDSLTPMVVTYFR